MDFPYYFSDIPYEAIGAATAAITFALIFTFGFAFIFYIFNAIGLYKMSKNRGYQNAWLAFIPVVNAYVLGAIADNINSCYSKKTSLRIWLIVLSVVNGGFGFAIISNVLGNITSIVNEAMLYETFPINNFLASMFLISSIGSLIRIAAFVLTCICQYKIYEDYNKNNATLFLVLSILFRISPFFIFALRNKPSASIYFASQKANPNQQYQNPYQQYQNNSQYQQPPYQSNPYQQQPYQNNNQYQQQPYQQNPYQSNPVTPQDTKASSNEQTQNNDENKNNMQ